MRAETARREEAPLRFEQQLGEIRSAILETKAVIDQREEGRSQRFMAASEALTMTVQVLELDPQPGLS